MQQAEQLVLLNLSQCRCCVAVVNICTVVTQAKEHGDIPTDLKYASVGMLVAAFLPPTPRVLGFASGIGVIIAFHYHKIMNINLIAQLALYLVGGISFLRYALATQARSRCAPSWRTRVVSRRFYQMLCA